MQEKKKTKQNQIEQFCGTNVAVCESFSVKKNHGPRKNMALGDANPSHFGGIPLIPLVLQAVFGDQGVVSRNVGELVDVAKLVALVVAGATKMKA